jgi:hypothetical protein
VLCTTPLQWEEYAGVDASVAARYCIDGFHRLVSWGAAGRLTPDARVPAWLAG